MHAKIVVGAALDTLPTLTGTFDFVFIDADKENNSAYVEWAVRLAAPGALIVVDNVTRMGRVLDPAEDDLQARGVRDMLELLDDRSMPVDKWHELIVDPTLADAILDRLVHNAYLIVLKGESMRRRATKFTAPRLQTNNENCVAALRLSGRMSVEQLAGWGGMRIQQTGFLIGPL